MKIGIITPAPPRSRYGNRVTALRWGRILRTLGHRVILSQQYAGEAYDLLIALHARRSHSAIRLFHHLHGEAPLIVALTGTDLYHDLPRSSQTHESLEYATRIIVLQPKGREELQPHLHDKVRVIYQSVATLSRANRRSTGFSTSSKISPDRHFFDVCVIGHLRAVKDPFRTALAARQLPAESRLRVFHIGSAMNEKMATQARAEMKRTPRYHWLGEQPRWRSRQILERSHLLVLSSKTEGGANVLSEAIVAEVPILASRISGTIGILGEDYPGYFSVGNTHELAGLLRRAETDPSFIAELHARCLKLAPLFDPRQEKQAWKNLLNEL
jgi:putative glycosyltransferase (TIGR04348 family)